MFVSTIFGVLFTKLSLIVTVLGGLIVAFFATYKKGEKTGIENEQAKQTEIENEIFKKEIKNIEESKQTSNYIDSLSHDELNNKLRNWKESEHAEIE